MNITVGWDKSALTNIDILRRQPGFKDRPRPGPGFYICMFYDGPTDTESLTCLELALVDDQLCYRQNGGWHAFPSRFENIGLGGLIGWWPVELLQASGINNLQSK